MNEPFTFDPMSTFCVKVTDNSLVDLGLRTGDVLFGDGETAPARHLIATYADDSDGVFHVCTIIGGKHLWDEGDYDRGYATGHVDFFYDDEVLDVSKAAGYLCEDCLNKILPSQLDRYFGVGAINLATKEVRVFEEHLRGFGLRFPSFSSVHFRETNVLNLLHHVDSRPLAKIKTVIIALSP